MLRMPRFTVETPRTLAEATARLAALGPDGMVLAGGTDVLPALKNRLHTPRVVVSLGNIPGLHLIEEQNGQLRLGALTTLAQVASSPLVQRFAPGLAEAAAQVASPQIRNTATLGGNVLLNTRCRYYNQSEFWRKSLGYCIKKDGTLCHVVPQGRRCVAALSSDTVPALVSLGAALRVEGALAGRNVEIPQLFRGDGATPHLLEPGELLTFIQVPLTTAPRGAYLKLRSRQAIDFPLLGVAVSLQLDEGTVNAAEVVVGALQARPVVVKDAPALLKGLHTDSPAYAQACETVAARAARQCHPQPNIPGDADWRTAMVPVLVRRALMKAAGRTWLPA